MTALKIIIIKNEIKNATFNIRVNNAIILKNY